MVHSIEARGKQAMAFQSNKELGKFLANELVSNRLKNALVVFFSNGSFDGVIHEFTDFAKSYILSEA